MGLQYETRDEQLTTVRLWPNWLMKFGHRLLSLQHPGTHCITIESRDDGTYRWRIDTVGEWENDE